MPREESLPGVAIGMTMDDFQIDGIRLDVTESLKSAVRYLIALDPRCRTCRLVMTVSLFIAQNTPCDLFGLRHEYFSQCSVF